MDMGGMMTYYINALELANTNVLKRMSVNSWNVVSKSSENIPYIGQTGQKPTQFNLDMGLMGDGRFDMITSMRAEIYDCSTILARSTTKNLYGDQKYVWLAQSSFNEKESGGKKLNVQLSGMIDPYQIHSCDFITGWAGESLSLDTAHDGKYAIKNTVASPSASTDYDITYTPGWSHDFSGRSYLTLWYKSDRASTAFTHTRVILQTSAGNYYYWTKTYSAGAWTFFECDLSNPSGTTGSPSLADINTFILRINTADTTLFYHTIDNIRIL